MPDRGHQRYVRRGHKGQGQAIDDQRCQRAANQPRHRAGHRFIGADSRNELALAKAAADKIRRGIAQRGHQEGQAQQHHLQPAEGRINLRQQAHARQGYGKEGHQRQQDILQLRLAVEQHIGRRYHTGEHGDGQQQAILPHQKAGNAGNRRRPHRPADNLVPALAQGMHHLVQGNADAQYADDRKHPAAHDDGKRQGA